MLARIGMVRALNRHHVPEFNSDRKPIIGESGSCRGTYDGVDSPAMKPDARIAEIIETLSNAEEYVRGIVGSSIQHSFDKERSSVTIGISGTGLYPNYFTQEPSETAPGRRSMVFNGRSHREILEDSFWGESWSSAAMSFAEVQALLGHVRDGRRSAEQRATALILPARECPSHGRGPRFDPLCAHQNPSDLLAFSSPPKNLLMLSRRTVRERASQTRGKSVEFGHGPFRVGRASTPVFDMSRISVTHMALPVLFLEIR
jgi:hypothetical protein